MATGQVADRYLSLDQGMVIAAIANELLTTSSRTTWRAPCADR